MTIVEISLLGGGIFIFLFGSLWLYLNRKNSDIKSKLFLYFLMLVIGPILIYLPTFGPLSGIKKRISAITEINSSEVESIVLQPTRRKDYNVYSLVEKDSVITDRNSIDEICEKLRKTTVLGHVHDENRSRSRNTRHACRVEIHYFDKKILSFGITNIWDFTKISFYSNGESGWNYATLEASELGLLLMKYWTTTDLKQQ